jgi:hypothetical protein
MDPATGFSGFPERLKAAGNKDFPYPSLPFPYSSPFSLFNPQHPKLS